MDETLPGSLCAETDDWARAIAQEWHDDLADPEQDIYTLAMEPLSNDRDRIR